jgi:hypothetical protein
VTDQTLLYATGGLAYGQVSVSGNLNVSASAPAFGDTFGPGTSTFSASKTNVGFAVGGGIEGKFTAWLPQNWSWKLEYLYLDLGSVSASTSFAAGSNGTGHLPFVGPRLLTRASLTTSCASVSTTSSTEKADRRKIGQSATRRPFCSCIAMLLYWPKAYTPVGQSHCRKSGWHGKTVAALGARLGPRVT